MPYGELTVALLLAVPAIYLALVALGRWLRRRAGVRLGWLYQVLAVAVAFFVPLQYFTVSPWILQTLGALVAMLGTVFALALVRRFAWEYYFGEVRHVDIPQFMRDVVALVVFLVAALLVLTLIFDVKIPGLVAGSGILAVILGLAMQDTLGNIVAGFAIHFEKPFRRGDWLILDHRHAEVMELNWRSTRLRTNDNIYLDIPNKQLTGGAIVNLTYPARLHAMRLTVGLEHSAPPNEAKEALLRAVQHAAGVPAEPPPRVFLSQFDETALTYEIKFWLEDHARYNEIVDAIRTNIWYELQRRQLRYAIPRRTLQIASAEDTMPSTVAAREVLRRQPLFQGLGEAGCDALLQRARSVLFGRGETIIEHGANGDSMFILGRGLADVFVPAGPELRRVATLRTGDCFGEMSLLTGERRCATVVAQTDCEVIEIEKERMAEVLQRNPELLQQLSELLARRKMENERLCAGATRPTPDRQRQQEYARGLITTLKSFFEL